MAPVSTPEALEAATITDWITEQDTKNWFIHSGYHVH